MPTFKRLVAQVHDIEAETPAQADEIARIRARALDDAMRPLGLGTAWAPTVVDVDSEDGALDDIIYGAYLLDETDGDTAYIALEETIVFEKLLAWRDAAVKAALESR